MLHIDKYNITYCRDTIISEHSYGQMTSKPHFQNTYQTHHFYQFFY